MQLAILICLTVFALYALINHPFAIVTIAFMFFAAWSIFDIVSKKVYKRSFRPKKK